MVVSDEMAPPEKTPPLLSFQQIMKEPLLPVDWLVEPMIANGDRVIVYGQFGSLKSWLLLHLGLSLSAGHQWLSEFPIPMSKQVLYVDEEMSAPTLRRRIQRLGLGKGVQSEPLPFRVASHHQITFDAKGASLLMDELAKWAFNPDVIIVETLRRVLAGSENTAEDVSAFWRNIEPLRAGGKTLIISHHMRKPYKDGEQSSRYRASGSTDILAGADSAFAIEVEEKGVISITCVKARNAEEPQPFFVSLSEAPGDGIEMRFQGFRQSTRPGATVRELASTILRQILTEAPGGIVKTADLLNQMESRGVARRTAERAWALIRRRGEAVPVSRGLWRRVSPAIAA